MTQRFFTIMSIALVAVIAAGCGESREVAELSTKVERHEQRLAKLENLAKQAAARRASVAAAESAQAPAPVECTVETVKSRDPQAHARAEKQMADRQAEAVAERTRFAELEKKARGFPAEPRGLLAVPYLSVAFRDLQCAITAEVKRGACALDASCSEVDGTPIARSSFPGWRGLVALVATGFVEDAAEGSFYPANLFANPLPSAAGYDAVDSLRQVLVSVAQSDALPALARWAIPLATPLIPDEHKATAQQALLKYWTASGGNMPDLEASATASATWVFTNEETGLQGFFLRRWMGAGRGQAGDRVITNLRRAMADAARALDMPQAAEWSRAATYHSRATAVAAATARPDAGATSH